MTAQVTTRKEARIDVGQETSKFALSAIGVVSALIGLWATACLISGFATSGVGSMVRGYISALTGM